MAACVCNYHIATFLIWLGYIVDLTVNWVFELTLMLLRWLCLYWC